MSRKANREATEDRTERALLRCLGAADDRPVAQRVLLNQLHLAKEDHPRVRRVLRRLIAQGRVRQLRGGRVVAAPPRREVHGVLERAHGGYARVKAEKGADEVIVAARHLADARPGDRVVVRVVSEGRDGRLRGVVSSVLESRRADLLGVFRERVHGGVVHPFDPVLGQAIHVPAAYRGAAEDLHAVRFEVVRGPARRTAREARVLGTLGHLDEPGTDVLVVARKYGLADEFPPPALAAAAALPATIRSADAVGRERFAEPPAVTIDGENARDFDDAIAVAELAGGGFRLFVHIADVAHFVEAGGALDDEARRRGTSVYFPDRVVPMCPERLSNDLCSLRPGEDRLVQSVVLDLSAAGAVRRVRFADGVIRSAARLTYSQAAAVLEGGKRVRGVPARIARMLAAAERLRVLLEHRRHRRGSIDFDLPEPQVLLDVEGAMTGITIEPRNRAHLMIEEFMLLANEAVAGELERHGAPCLYRVHQAPDPIKLAALASFVKSFGLGLRTGGDAVTPTEIQALLKDAAGRPEARIVGQVTLQTMQQARYDGVNIGHFGLAAPVYCHFTSPIRRYPDLVVHRQLRQLRRGEAPRGEHVPEGLEAVARSSSELERKAEAAERELLAWKKVAYIEGKVGETFQGVITGVTRFGLFIQLVDNLVEGLARVEVLGPEWFAFDASRFELRGSASGRAYRLGDRLSVRVDRVDRVLRRVDFTPVEAPAPPRGRQAHRGRARRG